MPTALLSNIDTHPCVNDASNSKLAQEEGHVSGLRLLALPFFHLDGFPTM